MNASPEYSCKPSPEREALGVHGDKALELQFARDELHHVESVRKQISDRIVHLRTEGRAPAQVTVIQQAKVPEFPDGPTLAMPLALIGIGAFFTPVLLLIGWDFCYRRAGERE
jgi:hypothetical protein